MYVYTLSLCGVCIVCVLTPYVHVHVFSRSTNKWEKFPPAISPSAVSRPETNLDSPLQTWNTLIFFPTSDSFQGEQDPRT